MSESSTTKILKNAILLERRGKAFYKKVAEESQSKALKRFFEMMSDEEARHIEILAEQFKEYQAHKRLLALSYDDKHASNLDTKILSKEIMEEISAADFEAAAISAAISMEKNAVKLYSENAAKTDDLDEKALFTWLTEWEKNHLKFLMDIDNDLTEKIWFDNQFWPF
jgi:rubrerythrin